jgi:hypothetical protein
MEPKFDDGRGEETGLVGGYGRIWESLYKGSLIGAGIEAFAVWPYVISNMKPHAEYGAAVQLNPVLLALIFGCDVKLVRKGIEKLCEPDADSHRKEEGGRRLVKISGYFYRVVNGKYYMGLRSKEMNRIRHAEAQREYRNRKKAVKKSGTTLADRIASKGDPRTRARVEELQAGAVPGAFGSGAEPQAGDGEEPPVEDFGYEQQGLTPEPE